MIYNVRDLINAEPEFIRSLPSPHQIKFENGDVLECKRNATIYSYVTWRLFREYPNTRILPKHHVTKTMNGKGLNTATHRLLLSAQLESVVRDNGLFLPHQKEPVLLAISEIIAQLSYDIPRLAEADVISIDILDFVQAANHPKIQELKMEAYKDTSRIQYAYDEIIKIVKSDPVLSQNGLGKAVRSGMVSNNQVLQCIAFRGFVTEVDGAIFPTPVMSNYTKGNLLLRDLVADSRTAAKSYLYSETPLQDSEYMSRQFHFFVTVVERIEWEDCGNSRTVSWFVRPPKKDNDGVTTYKGDLAFMKGKYYKENQNDIHYRIITGDEEHLYNKTIFIRSVIHCKAKDPHAKCSHCCGELAHNISRFANLGHLSSTTLTAILSQNILSIKHVNTSSVMMALAMDSKTAQYLHTGPKQEAFYVKEKVKTKNPKLFVLRSEAQGLIDLLHVVDYDDINPSRISSVTQAKIQITEKNRHIEELLNVSQRNTGMLLSTDFLHFLKKKGWKTTNTEMFEFDLSEWDFNKPVFQQPNREYSFVDLSDQVSATIKSKQKELGNRQQHNSAASLLQEIFDQVNSKLNVNIFCLEVIVSGLMVASKTSYELAYGVEHPVLGIVEQLNKNRSLGPALAFQGMDVTLTSPESFFQGHRPDSVLDVFINPKEVSDHYADFEMAYRLPMAT